MTPESLKEVMQRLGLSVRRLAVLVEVSASTVTRWRCGQRRIPGGVSRYLELRIKMLEAIGR